MAQAFKDTTGRVWTIDLNVSIVRRVRILLGVDLYKIGDDKFKLLDDILGDPCQLVDILFVICKDAADATQVTDEQFGSRFAGDVLEDAARAFVEALIDFFPKQTTRDALRALAEKGRQVQEKAMEYAMDRLNTIDPEKEAAKFIEQFGKSLESSASIQAG